MEEVQNATSAEITNYEEKLTAIFEVLKSAVQAVETELIHPISQTVHTIHLGIQAYEKLIASPEVHEILNNLQTLFIQGSEFITQLRDSAEEAGPLLKQYAWSLPLYTDWPLLFALAFKMKETEVTQEKIDALMCEHYSANDFVELKALVQALTDFDIEQERILILADCVNTIIYLQKEEEVNVHNIVIPTILCHIDRLYNDTHRIIENLFSKRNENLEGLKAPEIMELHRSKLDSTKYVGKRLDLVLDHVFANNESIPTDPEIYGKGAFRHKILHGEALKYGTFANTLRCFITFSILCEVKQEVLEIFIEDELLRATVAEEEKARKLAEHLQRVKMGQQLRDAKKRSQVPPEL